MSVPPQSFMMGPSSKSKIFQRGLYLSMLINKPLQVFMAEKKILKGKAESGRECNQIYNGPEARQKSSNCMLSKTCVSYVR